MKVRRFNNQGLEKFSEFLDSISDDKPFNYPEELLTDNESTEELTPPIEIEKRFFGSRYAASEYFFSIFKNSGILNIPRDKGLWAWLSLYYFDELCPADSKGRRRLGEQARWIPQMSWRRYYRHLLAGPYIIYSAYNSNPKPAMLVLCGPLDKPGDIVEQIASRQEIITNKGLMEAASKIYYDSSAKKPKRGAASKVKGSVRRFTDILDQFDVTWDLYSINTETVISMLPNEFRKFVGN